MFSKDFGCILCRQLADSHFQVRIFVKHLLWHQNYFGIDYPSPQFLDIHTSPLLCLTHPLILKIFQPPSLSLFNIFRTPYPPFVNGGVQTMGANTYLHGCVSLLASKCAVCLCLCVDVFYQIRVLAKNHIICQTAVNLMSSGIKHTGMWF